MGLLFLAHGASVCMLDSTYLQGYNSAFSVVNIAADGPAARFATGLFPGASVGFDLGRLATAGLSERRA